MAARSSGTNAAMMAQVGITGDVGDGSKRSERGHRPFCLSGAVAGEGQRRRRGVSDGVFSRGGGRPGRLGGGRNEGGGWQSQKQQCLSSGLYGRLGGPAGNDPEE